MMIGVSTHWEDTFPMVKLTNKVVFASFVLMSSYEHPKFNFGLRCKLTIIFHPFPFLINILDALLDFLDGNARFIQFSLETSHILKKNKKGELFMGNKKEKDFQLYKLESNFAKIIEICSLYARIENLTKFVLDLQIYSAEENIGQTESRIWLKCPKNDLGISLALYSVKLCSYDGMVTNDDVIDVFAEYQKFYVENIDKFIVKTDYGERTIDFSFEISMR